jgi:hypothetical protein
VTDRELTLRAIRGIFGRALREKKIRATLTFVDSDHRLGSRQRRTPRR